MAIKAIVVSNLSLDTPKFNAQIDEFLIKSKLIEDLTLTHVSAANVLPYIQNNDVDVCLFWDKDIYLAKKIAMHGIKVYNDIDAIFVCDDKALTALALEQHSVRQPRYFVFPEIFYGNIFAHYETYKDQLLALGFPLVLKHRHGSFGDQVFLAQNEEEAKTIIKANGTFKLMAQQYITKEFGLDYRVNVIGEEVIATARRVNKADFRSNINQGGSFTIVDDAPFTKIALAAKRAVGAHFAGVDIVLDENNTPYVIEVNSNMRTVAINKKSKHDITLALLNYIVKSN